MTKRKKHTIGIVIISLALCVFVVSVFISDIRFLNNEYNVNELNQGLDAGGVQLLMAEEELIKLPNVTLGDERPFGGGTQYYINSLKDYITTTDYKNTERVIQIVISKGTESLYGIKLGSQAEIAKKL